MKGIRCVDNHIGRNSALICKYTCVKPRYGMGLRLDTNESAELPDRNTRLLEVVLGIPCRSGKHLCVCSVAYS